MNNSYNISNTSSVDLSIRQDLIAMREIGKAKAGDKLSFTSQGHAIKVGIDPTGIGQLFKRTFSSNTSRSATREGIRRLIDRGEKHLGKAVSIQDKKIMMECLKSMAQMQKGIQSQMQTYKSDVPMVATLKTESTRIEAQLNEHEGFVYEEMEQALADELINEYTTKGLLYNAQIIRSAAKEFVKTRPLNQLLATTSKDFKAALNQHDTAFQTKLQDNLQIATHILEAEESGLGSIEKMSRQLNEGICFGRTMKATAEMWNATSAGKPLDDIRLTITGLDRFLQGLQQTKKLPVLRGMEIRNRATTVDIDRQITEKLLESAKQDLALAENKDPKVFPDSEQTIERIEEEVKSLENKLSSLLKEHDQLIAEQRKILARYGERAQYMSKQQATLIETTYSGYGFDVKKSSAGSLDNMLEELARIDAKQKDGELATFMVCFPTHAVAVAHHDGVWYLSDPNFHTTIKTSSVIELMIGLKRIDSYLRKGDPTKHNGKSIELIQLEYHPTAKFEAMLQKAAETPGGEKVNTPPRLSEEDRQYREKKNELSQQIRNEKGEWLHELYRQCEHDKQLVDCALEVTLGRYVETVDIDKLDTLSIDEVVVHVEEGLSQAISIKNKAKNSASNKEEFKQLTKNGFELTLIDQDWKNDLMQQTGLPQASIEKAADRAFDKLIRGLSLDALSNLQSGTLLYLIQQEVLVEKTFADKKREILIAPEAKEIFQKVLKLKGINQKILDRVCGEEMEKIFQGVTYDRLSTINVAAFYQGVADRVLEINQRAR